MSKAHKAARWQTKTPVRQAALAWCFFSLAGAAAFPQRTPPTDDGALIASDNATVGGRGDARSGPRDPNSAPATTLGPLDETAECGDILSDALQQDGAGTPCWADIRTVDHWNTMRLADGPTVQGGPGFLPADNESPTGFSFAVGGLGGILFTQGNNSSAYAGAGALSGFVQRRRWELMYEDGGALGNYQLRGSNLAGLNRAAVRANGQLTSRWLWQGSATNAYGTDRLRLLAPLDFRTVGATEAPVAETVAYGLHAGTLVDQQEDFKIRTAESRRSNWDFALAHTLRHYSDDGVTVQTVRGRADYLHATSRNSALGFLAGAADQTGPASCTLGGAGLIGLMQWGTRASISVSGSANGASSECGKRVQFTGDASLYLRAGDRDDLYLTGNRDLSGGVVENIALLDSAGGGIRHQFTRDVSLRLSGAAIYGTDARTKVDYNGTFAEASMSYPLGGGFLQETSYRHYQISKIPGGDNRGVLTFTLWWSPKKNRQTLQARH
jgi:hypothetical protein